MIESLVSLHQQYNSKTRLLVFYDDERVVKLLSILGISVELVSTRIPLYSLRKNPAAAGKQRTGRHQSAETRELSPAESDVIFNLLRGDSLLHIAEKRGTHPKPSSRRNTAR